MNLTQYAQKKESIIRRMLSAIVWVFQQFITAGLTPSIWNRMLRAIFPVVAQARADLSSLARDFHDDNRQDQTGDDSRHDVFLEEHYELNWLAESLRPSYVDFQKTKNVDGAINDVTNRVIKVAEDAGRRTLLRAVRDDYTRPVRGWARFDPRPPTCAFCTMMISRGPVYQNDTAGFKGTSQSAEKLWRENDTDAMNEMMNKWHPGCTCIVVPVYKLDNYPSQAQENEAFELYKQARKRAKEKTYKGILKEMRKLARNPNTDQDEENLAA